MVTKQELKQALLDLGVSKGMTLEVHSSLSSFGNLEGGAMTLIDTLKGTCHGRRKYFYAGTMAYETERIKETKIGE